MQARLSLPLLLLLTFAASASSARGDDPSPQEALFGAWETTNTKPRIGFRFEATKVYLTSNDASSICRARYTKDHVTYRSMGQKRSYRFELAEGKLTLTADGHAPFHLHRLEKTPPELADPSPLVFPEPGELTQGRISGIETELGERKKQDQMIRGELVARHRFGNSPKEAKAEADRLNARMREIDADNTAWVSSLCVEVGWIDGTRFGAQAAADALLLVQHSASLPLQLAALPWLEKDRKAGKVEAQPYAALYDLTRVRLGDPQRYGTRVLQSEAGNLLVLLLENKDKVDELRKEIGLGPLQDFLDKLRVESSGKEIRFEREDEEEGAGKTEKTDKTEKPDGK